MEKAETESRYKQWSLAAAATDSAPILDQSVVPRPRLAVRLRESSAQPLVLMKAPPGYSKTTSLAEWSVADDRVFAWLSISHRHDDPALLISAIAGEMDRIERVNPDVLAALATPAPSISRVVLPRLADTIHSRTEPFVLVMDDLHLLSSPEAFEVIETVLGSLPPGSQLALASRTEPPLPLGRLRGRRQLLELTQADLAMTRDESIQLLANIGLDLTNAQAGQIFDHTEGWPVAVYLAGLSLAGQGDLDEAVSSFAGDDRVLVDYFRDEFLSAAGSSRRRFMLRTSILDELSGPLCDEVLECSGSARALREMARSNALVVALDRKEDRFRYHHLFAEMLLSELRHQEPELEAQLHARASGWYAAHSDSDRAIDHAIAAGQVDRAGDLIWQAFPEISGRGRIASLERWFNLLGDERMESSSSLALSAAYRHVALGDGEQAAHWSRMAVRAADSASAPEGAEPMEAHIRLLKATAATEGVLQMGKDAECASELLPADSPWQAPCFLYRGTSSQMTGHPQRAAPLLREAVQRGAVVSPIVQVLALGQLCLMALEHDPASASRLSAQARDQVERCGLTDYPVMVMVHAVSALIRSREGKVEAARADVELAKPLLAELTAFLPWYEAQVRIVLARACARLDQVTTARQLLEDASAFAERTPDASILTQWIEEARASLDASSAMGRDSEWALTTAELRTLQYMPSNLSFREVADRIHVSPNTVKTQAQAIYRKLQVSSRSEAVITAREAGLLGEDPTLNSARS